MVGDLELNFGVDDIGGRWNHEITDRQRSYRKRKECGRLADEPLVKCVSTRWLRMVATSAGR